MLLKEVYGVELTPKVEYSEYDPNNVYVTYKDTKAKLEYYVSINISDNKVLFMGRMPMYIEGMSYDMPTNQKPVINYKQAYEMAIKELAKIAPEQLKQVDFEQVNYVYDSKTNTEKYELRFYQLKNGKWCCSEHTSQCPAIKEKNSNGLKKCYQENRKDCSHLDGIRGQFSKNKSIMSCNKIFHKHSIEEIFCINSNVCKSRIKELIIKEKILEYKCDICGNMGEWNNQKIILHVDHINGVNNDKFSN